MEWKGGCIIGSNKGDAKTLMAVGTGRALGSRLKRVNEPSSALSAIKCCRYYVVLGQETQAVPCERLVDRLPVGCV
jgi:hypothetical protein